MSHEQCLYYKEVRIRDAGFKISTCSDRTPHTFTERGFNTSDKFFPTYESLCLSPPVRYIFICYRF